MSPTSAAGGWRRSANGKVVHRADCRRVGLASHAWAYAQHVGSDEQMHTLLERFPRMRACQRCLPKPAPKPLERT